jgi:hypothetical protein
MAAGSIRPTGVWRMTPSQSRVGVVFAAGGARGAYEVGALLELGSGFSTGAPEAPTRAKAESRPK